jgi:adenylate cyclase
VRYVLEGSVRRAGDQVRITAQLIDAQTQGHVWAQRYDRPQQQVFAVQDELIRAIVSSLVGNVLEADLKAAAIKPPHSLSAYEHALLGRRYLRVASSSDNIVKAYDAFRKAIDTDSGFADAYRGLAQVYLSQAMLNVHWKGQPEFERAPCLRQAESLARKAIELNPRLEMSYAVLGTALAFQGRFAEAIVSGERAVAVNPNHPDAHVDLGIVYMLAGRHAESLEQHDLALRLDPYPSPRVWGMRAFALFMAEQYEAAVESAQRSIALSPNYRTPHTVLAAVYAETADLPKARAAMDKVRELSPNYSAKMVAEMFVFQRPEEVERWIRAQRLAGLPE